MSDRYRVKNKKRDYSSMDMIEVHPVEDISYEFVETVRKSNKNVAMIANREMIEYVTDCVLKEDFSSAAYINFLDEDDIPYCLIVDSDGAVFVDILDMDADTEYFNIAYISMDGDVPQRVIDQCLDNEKKVILFGDVDEKPEDDSVWADFDYDFVAIPMRNRGLRAKLAVHDDFPDLYKYCRDLISEYKF